MNRGLDDLTIARMLHVDAAHGSAVAAAWAGVTTAAVARHRRDRGLRRRDGDQRGRPSRLELLASTPAGRIVTASTTVDRIRPGPGRPCTICDHPDRRDKPRHAIHAHHAALDAWDLIGPPPIRAKLDPDELLLLAADILDGTYTPPTSERMEEWQRQYIEQVVPKFKHAATIIDRTIPKAIRRSVLERDEHRCVWCGATDELHIDHVWPWSLGGPATIANLQVLCRPCNLLKRDHLPGDELIDHLWLGTDGRPTMARPRP